MKLNNAIIKLTKYLAIGLIITFSAIFIIGSNQIKTRDAIILGMIAAISFAVLEILSPTYKIEKI